MHFSIQLIYTNPMQTNNVFILVKRIYAVTINRKILSDKT